MSEILEVNKGIQGAANPNNEIGTYVPVSNDLKNAGQEKNLVADPGVLYDDNQRPESKEEINNSEKIEISKENFLKIVDYIEKNGFLIHSGKGKEAEHQYTFFDSKGNRHAMIAVKRDGVVFQVSVWAYYKGINDLQHFFGYYINEKEVGPFLNLDTRKEKDDVKFAFDEFLQKVLNQEKNKPNKIRPL